MSAPDSPASSWREHPPLNVEKEDDDSSQYLQEACYYLLKKGLTLEQVSKALEVSEQEATRLHREFESKIASGKREENEVDRNLWEDVYNDSVGNEKITFVRDNGFYHCRRDDLAKTDSTVLMAICHTSKTYLDFDVERLT